MPTNKTLGKLLVGIGIGMIALAISFAIFEYVRNGSPLNGLKGIAPASLIIAGGFNLMRQSGSSQFITRQRQVLGLILGIVAACILGAGALLILLW